MKYKAIIFDLDGTAIPNRRDGMPSEHLVEVVKKIKEKVLVCAATGRGINLTTPILKKLNLGAPCIISGGTIIVNPKTAQILWQKQMAESQVKKIVEIASKYKYHAFFTSEEEGIHPKDKIVNGPENIIYIEPVTPEDTKKMLEDLKEVPDIAVHPVMSWSPGYFDIHVTHREATKKHAMEVLLDILKVKKEETIAFGDSNNDLPLFELAGYKVAMSTGSEDLKKAADFIALNEDDDGLARALEELVMIQ